MQRLVLSDTLLSALLQIFFLVLVQFSYLIEGLDERLGDRLNKYINQNKHVGSKAYS